jgi:MFS family permease
LSLAASVALAVAGHSVVLLFTGRAVAGLSNGAAFSAGTAWLRELSRPPLGSASEHGAARRAAVSMTAGFALGPLVSGLLAQWAPAPGVVPYLPHIALMVIVILLLPGLPETRTDGIPAGLRASLPGLASPRFRGVVAPMAPWVFAAPAIGFALLPSVVGANRAPDGIALTASITTLCALAGVMVQPFARRLDARVHANQAAITGLVVLAAGLTIGAVAAHEQQAWLLVPSSIILGAAYGLCLVAGLVEVQRLADQGAQAGLTAVYYALCYLGFAAPYLLAVAAQLASYAVMLVAMAALALVTASVVARHDGTLQGDGGR